MGVIRIWSPTGVLAHLPHFLPPSLSLLHSVSVSVVGKGQSTLANSSTLHSASAAVRLTFFTGRAKSPPPLRFRFKPLDDLLLLRSEDDGGLEAGNNILEIRFGVLAFMTVDILLEISDHVV